MKTISLKNSQGDTIEVKRGAGAMILVRHSDKDAETFGEFNTIDMLSQDPKAWEYLAKEEGVYINSEAGKEALDRVGKVGFLIIRGEQILIGPEDGQLISEAIKQLD